MLTLNSENFYNTIKSENKPVMVEFWAPWCSYCQRLSPTFDAITAKYKEQMIIGKVNIDDAMDLAIDYQVEIIPSILIFEQGQLIKRVVNPTDQAAIEEFILSKPTENVAAPAEKAPAKVETPAAPEQPGPDLEAIPDMPIYSYSLEKPNGEMLDLASYKGKVMLIVNTATGCGFTPQYKQLEEIYAQYKSKGLEILDIPCNQFAGQAPGTDEEIHHFCTVNFGTSFPQLKKSDVNGPNALPLYQYLKSQKGFKGFGSSLKGMAMAAMLMVKDSNYKSTPDIKWNFTKFLVDRQGNVVARFEPTADMKDVAKAIAALL